MCTFFFFFFKQKTAYEMRISDWSSDVCSSDLFLPRTSLPAFALLLSGCLGIAAAWVLLALAIDSQAGWMAVVAALDAVLMLRLGRMRPGWPRSEERRVGKEWVSTCRSRWSPYP